MPAAGKTKLTLGDLHKNMKCLATILTLTMILTSIAGAAVFESKTYSIKIEHNCPEGCVSCGKIDLSITNKRMKRTLEVAGKTEHSTSKDGSPGQFWGYSCTTKSGMHFFIHGNGNLEITDPKDKLILSELGKWKH